MNPAPVARLLATLVQAADNNTALALSDTNEAVWHDCFNRIIQTQRLTSVLITLVSRLALTRGYPILDDTILEKFTAKLSCVFELKDLTTGQKSVILVQDGILSTQLRSEHRFGARFLEVRFEGFEDQASAWEQGRCDARGIVVFKSNKVKSRMLEG